MNHHPARTFAAGERRRPVFDSKAEIKAIAEIMCNQMAENAASAGRTRRQRQRTYRRELVIKFTKEGFWPLIRWIELLDAPRKHQMLSLAEATAWCEEELARQERHKTSGPYGKPSFCYRTENVRNARDRLIVARYFRLFGRELWSGDADPFAVADKITKSFGV